MPTVGFQWYTDQHTRLSYDSSTPMAKLREKLAECAPSSIGKHAPNDIHCYWVNDLGTEIDYHTPCGFYQEKSQGHANVPQVVVYTTAHPNPLVVLSHAWLKTRLPHFTGSSVNDLFALLQREPQGSIELGSLTERLATDNNSAESLAKLHAQRVCLIRLSDMKTVDEVTINGEVFTPHLVTPNGSGVLLRGKYEVSFRSASASGQTVAPIEVVQQYQTELQQLQTIVSSMQMRLNELQRSMEACAAADAYALPGGSLVPPAASVNANQLGAMFLEQQRLRQELAMHQGRLAHLEANPVVAMPPTKAQFGTRVLRPSCVMNFGAEYQYGGASFMAMRLPQASECQFFPQADTLLS